MSGSGTSLFATWNAERDPEVQACCKRESQERGASRTRHHLVPVVVLPAFAVVAADHAHIDPRQHFEKQEPLGGRCVYVCREASSETRLSGARCGCVRMQDARCKAQPAALPRVKVRCESVASHSGSDHGRGTKEGT